MSKKSLVITLILLLFLISSFLSLWVFWGELTCGIIGKGFSDGLGGSLWVFLAFWILFLAVLALFVLLVKDTRVVIGGVFLTAVSLTLFILRGHSFTPLMATSGVVLFIALLIFSFKLRQDVNNHINFSAGHLLPPQFRSLGFFLTLILSFYIYEKTKPLTVDFKIVIPESIFEAILDQVPTDELNDYAEDMLGIDNSTDPLVTSQTTFIEEMNAFFEGRLPVPETIRPYFEGQELPEETKSYLRDQGIPIEMVEDFLSSVIIDAEGNIKEPISGGGQQILTAGLKAMLEDQINQAFAPFYKYLPLVYAITSFTILFYINLMIVFAGTFITWLLLKVLLWSKVVILDKEMVECERLTI
ncbi:hypothetical protein KKB83_01010 [Patescibacteria group bacterium]|nr:hypothetical protein [Patescibacteria group bacterium]